MKKNKLSSSALRLKGEEVSYLTVGEIKQVIGSCHSELRTISGCVAETYFMTQW